MSRPFDAGEVQLGVSPLQYTYTVPPREIDLQPAISVRHVGRHFARHRPEQLHKQPTACKIGIKRHHNSIAPERQTRLRQYQDTPLLEISPQFKPAELEVIGHFGEERYAGAVAV